MHLTFEWLRTGTAWGVSCCVWEAAEVLAAGGSAAAAAARAEKTATVTGTSFIIQALDFARAGGRFSMALPDNAVESDVNLLVHRQQQLLKMQLQKQLKKRLKREMLQQKLMLEKY